MRQLRVVICDDQYLLMSYQARDFRKELIGSLYPSALFPVQSRKMYRKTSGKVSFLSSPRRKNKGLRRLHTEKQRGCLHDRP
jgi:hypothetical protein